MNKVLIYDFPTRIFHWLFVSLFLSSYFIASQVDDESLVYSYHMLAGIVLSMMVVLRIIWGFVGTKYARFSEFHLRPKELISYFKEILSNKHSFWKGHNPASSWAGIVLHTFRYKDMIGLSMIHGKKSAMTSDEEIIFVFGFSLYKKFDASTRKLHLFNQSLTLGEEED